MLIFYDKILRENPKNCFTWFYPSLIRSKINYCCDQLKNRHFGGPFDLMANNGMIAFEYYFPLYNEVRLQSKLSWKRFFAAFSSRPAELLGFGKTHGRLLPGYEANFIVFDPQAPQTVNWSLSHSNNSPFEGMEIRGKVVEHWLKGKKVYG